VTLFGGAAVLMLAGVVGGKLSLAVGVFGVLFGLLVGYAALVRIRSLRLVRTVHFDPPAAAAAAAPRLARGFGTLSAAQGWVALAKLWTGDVDGAEQALDAATKIWGDPGLRLWLSAGRGELDLERALAASEPSTLGERYRWAVALALAALRAGAAAQVADRVLDWLELSKALPNRFGRLLEHLAVRIGERAGTAPGDAPPRQRADDLAWLDVVWPFAA
jgi:hypothetical protein